MSNLPTPSQSGPLTEETAAQELLERLRMATLGDYEILGELGRGGMATVYLAHEISLDRKVAIKVMSPSMVHGLGMVERFKREARTAANLSHPNIIPIYTVREVSGLLFCVIKLVQGTALDVIMKELGQLPVPMIQGILAQVGGALGYAHRHGVIHRDIKPGNILIDDEGWAVVTDFGIAKVAESEVKMTSTGMAIGTPTYMSPEQATADAVTGASDQYSLGIVAYEMLTGKVPFTGTSMMAIMYSHFHDEPPSIRELRPDCPDQLCNAVMRMLRKDPKDRWPSMEDAIAAAGSRPLAPEDPNRSQLIALAKTGTTARLIANTTTPRSPIPRVSNRRAATVHARRNPLLFGTTALALVGAGFVFAKMMADGPSAPADTLSSLTPPVTAASDSVTLPAVTPRPDSQPGRAGPNAAPTSAIGQTRVVPSPPTSTAAPGRGTPAGRANVPVVESQRPNTQRAESSATPPLQQKAETTVSAPLPTVPPPPVNAASTTAQPAPNVRQTADPAAEVAGVIQTYARALAASDLAAARRLYPGMPTDQREGLEALWREGGTMTPNWTVSNVAIDGDVATARIQGTNVVRMRGQNSTVPVSLRARLERRGGEWRLMALVN
ncbi:MAG TPA: protein kinase [Gemmatimonadaceae bacterium]|nr:protein kinase [Gemmatimonadaceae bacterium]